MPFCIMINMQDCYFVKFSVTQTSLLVTFIFLKIWFFLKLLQFWALPFVCTTKAPSILSSSILQDLLCLVACIHSQAPQLIFLKNLYLLEESRFFTQISLEDTPRFSLHDFFHHAYTQLIRLFPLQGKQNVTHTHAAVVQHTTATQPRSATTQSTSLLFLEFVFILFLLGADSLLLYS